MQLLFGFEYLVLLTAIVSTFCKYVLQCVDHNAEQQWDAKAIYMFYVDIVQVGGSSFHHRALEHSTQTRALFL